jgi:streptothricin acetyltransferase
MLDLLPQPQEAFEIIGRLVPKYDGKEWSISETLLDTPYMKTYPNDVFDSKMYIDNPNEAAFIAMLDGLRVGSIRVGRRWNKNAFIDDLVVDIIHRGRGVGTMLMDAAVNWGKENDYHGISLETQDNNLLACRFYLKYGGFGRKPGPKVQGDVHVFLRRTNESDTAFHRAKKKH